MRKIFFCLFLVLLTSVVTGCLQSPVAQRNDLEEMKRRLALVEQATISSQPEQSLNKRLEEQAGRLADLRAEVDALRFELQRLSGRYEEGVHERKQLHELLTMIRSEQELKLARIEERLAAQTTAVPPLNAGGQRGSAEPGTGAEEQYEKALQLIQNENRFSDGRKALQLFLRDYPQHELAVNAIYWIGEAYYGEKQYEKAILQFQDVIHKFSKHTKASAAMFKQGLAFGALGDKGMEKTLLQKVVSEYPQSAEAKKAKTLLK
ncbi:MAG: tol-pal system protein YbgF [Desulfuromonadales bacterium]|nr:tol-pal system protein YbgF [Desulfuromonadales bacterium]